MIVQVRPGTYERGVLELPGGMRVLTPWIGADNRFILRAHIERYRKEGAKLLYMLRYRHVVAPCLTVPLPHETP